MASLSWTNLNPKIILETTRKQFFNRYCYKLVIVAYGSRVLHNDVPVVEALANRISRVQYNQGGSWKFDRFDDLDEADSALLEELRSIKNGHDNSIKMRVEEPWVQIYADNEQKLMDIALRFNTAGRAQLLSISSPWDSEQLALLEQGHILSKLSSKLEFKYKIVLRDGSYSAATKAQVATYLNGLGSEVKVTKSSMRMLTSELSFIWGCFFYTNDPGIATMLRLIAPGMVGKIHEIVKV